MATTRNPKRCAVCGAQATNRCFRCHQLYCQEHADHCGHTVAVQGLSESERAIREATCGICGRLVTNERGDRYITLDACLACGALVCDLCLGHVETRPGPHGFSVRVWCEDCTPKTAGGDSASMLHR